MVSPQVKKEAVKQETKQISQSTCPLINKNKT